MSGVKHMFYRLANAIRLPVAGVIVAVAFFCVSSPQAFAATTSHLNKAKATKTITANFETFFSGKSSAKSKIALLQNGSKFSSIIDAQASSTIAESTTARVSTVTDLTKSSAKVKYTIDLGGQPALKNTTGSAVFQAGTWKVSDSSFCTLLALEQVKSPECPSANS
jgi:methionine-rich copper-binding protein CopC